MIAAIDYSMSSPAMTILDTSTGDYTFYAIKQRKRMASNSNRVVLFEPVSDYELDIDRYSQLSELFINVLKEKNIKHVFMEGYSYGSRGNTYNIGENTGVLKLRLLQEGIKLTIFQPTEIKKFATGRGNSNKTIMYEFYTKHKDSIDLLHILNLEKRGEKIPSPIDDLVDSFWIAKLAESTLK